MAKQRIKFFLIVPDEADGLLVKSALDSYLPGKNLYAVDNSIAVSFNNLTSQWSVNGSVRFNTPLEADTWYADIQAKWNVGSLKAKIGAGSSVSVHSCNHEEKDLLPCDRPAALLLKSVK